MFIIKLESEICPGVACCKPDQFYLSLLQVFIFVGIKDDS